MRIMKCERRKTRWMSVVLCLMLVLGSVVPAFAAAPAKEDVEYEGNGTVDVEFAGKVAWNNPTVVVKDANSKAYKATIIKKDNDDITFKINGYKEGVKYTFTISGVRKIGTTGYGKVSGTVTIPKAKAKTKPAAKTTAKPATVKYIAQTTAKNTAINAAVKNLGAQKATIRDMEVEKDKYMGKVVWEVSFEAKRTGKKGIYEFEYIIDAVTGKVLKTKVERD